MKNSFAAKNVNARAIVSRDQKSTLSVSSGPFEATSGARYLSCAGAATHMTCLSNAAFIRWTAIGLNLQNLFSAFKSCVRVTMKSVPCVVSRLTGSERNEPGHIFSNFMVVRLYA